MCFKQYTIFFSINFKPHHWNKQDLYTKAHKYKYDNKFIKVLRSITVDGWKIWKKISLFYFQLFLKFVQEVVELTGISSTSLNKHKNKFLGEELTDYV